MSRPDRLLNSLRTTATLLRAANAETAPLESAYSTWSTPGVGPSFFTKWFAFAGHVDGRAWQPLILDDRVFRTLNKTLGVSTRDMAESTMRAHRYRAYVEHLHAWAAELSREQSVAGITAERLEWVLFRHNGEAPVG